MTTTYYGTAAVTEILILNTQSVIVFWLLDVSCEFQHGTCRAGDHGDECLGVAVTARSGPGGLEQAIEPFYTRIGVGGCPTPEIRSA